MATNTFFNNYSQVQEQSLIDDLVIESIKQYGVDVIYMSRAIKGRDKIFNEDDFPEYNEVFGFEVYVKNMEGFEGEGDSAFAASEGQKTGAVLAPRPTGPDAAPQLAIAAPVAPVKTDVAPANVVMVQLGAFGDSAKAESAWAALNKRFGFLSGVSRKIAEAKVEGGRAVFRLQAITSNSSEAQQLCAKLRLAGENCLIVR
mgnify:CR=1 FL=1